MWRFLVLVPLLGCGTKTNAANQRDSGEACPSCKDAATQQGTDAGDLDASIGDATGPDAGGLDANGGDTSVGDAAGADAGRHDASEGGGDSGIVAGKLCPDPPQDPSAVYAVGTVTPLPPGAIAIASLSSVPWSSLPAGALVLVGSGTYGGTVTITATGTATNPIVVQGSNLDDLPVLGGSVDITGASYVNVCGLKIESPTYSGFVLQKGSHHITLSGNTVIDAPNGIDVTGGAGTGDAFTGNTISGSNNDGIVIDGINAQAGDPTTIEYNAIDTSGFHGIEIHGSNYVVEHNQVTSSGRLSGGCSGIHVYVQTQGEGTGANNSIRYNYSFANEDKKAYDGNGIELDQWTSGNTVAFNVVWGNDGAGIIVYDSATNTVYGNTAYGDGVNSGGQTRSSYGEVILSGDGANPGTTSHNQLYDNLLVATRSQVPAMYVDSAAVAAANNTVGPNLTWNTQSGGYVLRWTDGKYESTASQIDTVTGQNGSLVDAPAFVNPSVPLTGGLALTTQPAGGDGVALDGQIDMAGKTFQTGWSCFGAYFTP